MSDDGASVASSRNVHRDLTLDDMSKEQLLALMEEEDKRIKALHEKVQMGKTNALQRKLREAEVKQLSQREKAHIMQVFKTFDADGSGRISVEEFRNLSKKMGYAMTPEEAEEAIAPLVPQGKEGLDFTTFLRRWASSEKRGGNKGLKLDLIKAKLRAEMAAREMRKHLSAPRVVEHGRKQSINVNVTVGDQGNPEEGEARFKTSSVAVLVPSDPLEFRNEVKRLFPDEAVEVMSEEQEELLSMRYVAEVVFEMRDPVNVDDVEGAAECFDDAFADVIEGSSGSLVCKARVRDVSGKKQLTIALGLRTPLGRDPLSQLTSKLITADDPDAIGASLFNVISVAVRTRKDGESFLAWDCDTPLLELFDMSNFNFHAKVTSQLSEVLEMLLFYHLIGEAGPRRARAGTEQAGMMAALARLVQVVDITHHNHSPKEAMEAALDTISMFPIRVAARQGVAADDELIAESEELKKRFRKNLDDVFKTEMTVPILLAKMMTKLLRLEEYTTAMQAIGNACLGFKHIKVSHPLASAKITTRGFPFFKYLFNEDVEEMMQRVVEQRRAAKAQEPDIDDRLFPASKRVLDKAGEEYGKAFRALLSANKDDVQPESDSDSD